MNFEKPHLSIEAQIATLEDRGLVIDDYEIANKYLRDISYFRLIPYVRTLEVQNNGGNHSFIEGATFDAILQMYLFDRELRLLLFDLIERLEVSFRTQISYNYCAEENLSNLDSDQFCRRWWYESSENFSNTSQHKRDLRKIDSELDLHEKEVFLAHYSNRYTYPLRPPSWMVFETISMGLISKIFNNLKPSRTKKAIAHHYRLQSPDVLASWMHSLTFVRNVCAHHGRLWDRVITVSPMLPTQTIDSWVENRSFDQRSTYAFLCCAYYLLKSINHNTTFIEKFNHIREKYPIVNIHRMGFPQNWSSEAFWAS